MGILDRARSASANFVQPRIQATMASVLPGTLLAGNLGNVLASALRSGSTQSVRAAIDSARANSPDLLMGELWNRLPNTIEQAARSTQPSPAPRTYRESPLPTARTPIFGGLTWLKYKEFATETALTDHAWKNLFFVEVSEMTRSASGPPWFNLLAQDVTFSPVTMPGEAVPLGSAVMDNLNASERVEVSMTVLDDAVGRVKKWFLGRCAAAVHKGGTFGLPQEYLVTIEIKHMAPDGSGSDAERMRHKFLMRPSNIQVSLSRRAPELEELELTFTEADTFI